MIVKKLTSLILFVTIIKTISGASISNVFVERETSPARYTYNAPFNYASVANPQYSHINALPASGQSYADPCVTPCVIPEQVLNSVRPTTNFVTYNSPYGTVPILLGSPNEEPQGYQYSYVVYDKNTGDHKAQRELSDGSVVHGEYSLVQPDGYVRKVQYVADDSKGFNAVVKNYLPVASGDNRKVEMDEIKEDDPPCNDLKKESLKQQLAVEIEERLEKYDLPAEQDNKSERIYRPNHEYKQEYMSKNYHDSKYDHKWEQKQRHELVHDYNYDYSYEQNDLRKLKEETKEISDQHPGKRYGKERHGKEEHNKKFEQESTVDFNIYVENRQQKLKNKPNKEFNDESSEATKKELKDKYYKKSQEFVSSDEKHNLQSKKDSKGISNEDAGGTTLIYVKHKEEEDLVIPEQRVFVPYHDIVGCLEAAPRTSNERPSDQKDEPSLITYILLNKPC